MKKSMSIPHLTSHQTHNDHTYAKCHSEINRNSVQKQINCSSGIKCVRLSMQRLFREWDSNDVPSSISPFKRNEKNARMSYVPKNIYQRWESALRPHKRDPQSPKIIHICSKCSWVCYRKQNIKLHIQRMYSNMVVSLANNGKSQNECSVQMWRLRRFFRKPGCQGPGCIIRCNTMHT